MEFEDDDLPLGRSNWEQVVTHLSTYYVRWVRHAESRWLGVSRRDDLRDATTVEQRSETAREHRRRWYEKFKSDPIRVARRNAVKRRNYHRRQETE